ncbi:MAG: trigger factor, partial [Clostridia bacterium]|nr:trigger factor [Clostridia bacterium]
MSLKNVTKPENTKAVIEFAVDAETFEKAVTAVYNKKKANITLPGFRKGKAPRSLIEKMYGKGFLYEDAINDVLPEAYESALKESGLETVGKAEFDIVSIDENGLVMTATVYLKPEVSIADYQGITLTKKTVRVTEDEIMAEINKVRERNERRIDVTDRAAAMGDVATIDFEGFKDGVAFEGGKGESYELKLGSGSFIPGFEEQVAGHTIGEEFEINVTFPENYGASDLAGAAVIFKIKLHSIQAVELPELDDEFAKDVSDFETFAEYKADVKATISKRKADAADRETDDEIVDVLVSKLVGDIPEIMYEMEVEEMLAQYDNRLKSQGLDLDTYLKYTGMTMDALKADVRSDAEKRVKSRLALEKIAQENGIDEMIVIGLCNDELGYIVPPSDFLLSPDAPYIERITDGIGEDHYEETNSVGPACAQCIADALEAALKN